MNNGPMEVLESVRGFMKSRIILSGAGLGLFTLIARGVDNAESLAEAGLVRIFGGSHGCWTPLLPTDC